MPLPLSGLSFELCQWKQNTMCIGVPKMTKIVTGFWETSMAKIQVPRCWTNTVQCICSEFLFYHTRTLITKMRPWYWKNTCFFCIETQSEDNGRGFGSSRLKITDDHFTCQIPFSFSVPCLTVMAWIWGQTKTKQFCSFCLQGASAVISARKNPLINDNFLILIFLYS